jgi:hypothetical protein
MDGGTQPAKRWPHFTYHMKIGAGKTTVATPFAPPTKPRPITMLERRSGYNSRLPMDRKGTAPSADQDGFRRTNRRAPSRLVPTRASGATRYNI